jgi:predicted transcriptional regulator
VFWFLEQNDLLKSNIKLIPLQPAGLVDNFLGGQSNAVATWEPFVSTIQKRKKDLNEDLGTIFRADSLGFKGIMTVATKATWAEKNQKLILSYNKAMEKAAKFVKDSTSVAQNILSKETGLPLEIIVNSWERFNYDYKINLENEKILISDVIRRIKFMIPEKKDITEENINTYFK